MTHLTETNLIKNYFDIKKVYLELLLTLSFLNFQLSSLWDVIYFGGYSKFGWKALKVEWHNFFAVKMSLAAEM